VESKGAAVTRVNQYPSRVSELLAEYKEILERAAQQWRVSPEIHPDDFLFQWLCCQDGFESKEKAIQNYFNDGANSAQELAKILAEVCGLGEKPLSLLEFASGYGCVTRHIRNVMPLCSTTACDIHPAAVEFVKNALKTDAILSNVVPEDLVLGETFDVVFALSFFSHMPKNSFLRWLRKLASFVRPEGFLIFTTHGLVSRRLWLQDYEFDQDGFFFHPDSEQKDLSPLDYGAAFVKPQYVFGGIFETPNLNLKYFREGYWWNHQDVYIVKVVPEQMDSSGNISIIKSFKQSVASSRTLAGAVLSRLIRPK
jgi:SAM-dependent methyltransferase